ncbi:hypothetical protein GCM10010967_12840 [Dyadobacter beijingensis]|uniref:Uncharacterized protein n=1 Tax=Dyadobacter beijingensis TaxID=365489 RepID=A0ABQ2HJ63_9BACT|nr:hypothetical protein GCM10010967_12840 [Dyadobacter beijingensis]
MQACVSSNDNSVNPSEEVPVSVVDVIQAKYPSATAMKFSMLEEGKVYQADFDMDGKNVSVIASRTEILNAFEESGQQNITSVNTKLNGLGMEKGNLSGLKTLMAPGQAERQIAQYDLRGTNYRLTLHQSGYVTITTRQLTYETKSLDDLPEKIKAYIQGRNKPNIAYLGQLPLLEKPLKEYLADKNEFTFSSCAVYSLPDKSKQYQVFVKYYGITDLPLIFNENSELIWVGSFNRLESLVNFDDLSGGSSNVSKDDLSYFTSQFKASNELKDYPLDGPISRGQASVNVYDNQKGFEFRLSKPSLDTDESWVLRYDAGRKLIDSYYSGQRR